jgi:hypothetical protein
MSDTPRLLQRIALAIALAGLVSGAAVYLRASADPELDALTQQREMNQVARLGGTATVQTVKFDLWLASLWHGQRLGLTLAALGMLVGFVVWRVGLLMSEED